MERLKIEYVSIDSLKEYKNNAKIHTAEQIEQIKSSIATFPRLMEIATYEQTIELIKKIVSFIAVKHNDTTGDDDVHIVLRGAEDTVNFNLARERSVMFHSGIDSIFNTSCGISGKAAAFLRVKR